MGQCEWNPTHKRAAYLGESCRKEATVSLGASGQWHLCEDCARLPEFKRYKVRGKISGWKPPTDKEGS